MGDEEHEHLIPAFPIQSKFPMYSKIKLSLFHIEFGSFNVTGLLGVVFELSRTCAKVSWVVESLAGGAKA